MALSSAWQTKGYLVSSAEPVRAQGKSLSSQPMGRPLYPTDMILLFWFTMHAPTCVFGSFDRMADKSAMPMKYSSQEM